MLDYFALFPPELHLEILKFIRLVDRIKFECLNHQWRQNCFASYRLLKNFKISEIRSNSTSRKKIELALQAALAERQIGKTLNCINLDFRPPLYVNKLDHVELKIIAESCSNLGELSIENCRFEAETCKNIKNIRPFIKLQSFRLIDVDGIGFGKIIGHLAGETLKNLRMERVFTTEIRIKLNKCKRLESLIFTNERWMPVHLLVADVANSLRFVAVLNCDAVSFYQLHRMAEIRVEKERLVSLPALNLSQELADRVYDFDSDGNAGLAQFMGSAKILNFMSGDGVAVYGRL